MPNLSENTKLESIVFFDVLNESCWLVPWWFKAIAWIWIVCFKVMSNRVNSYYSAVVLKSALPNPIKGKFPFGFLLKGINNQLCRRKSSIEKEEFRNRRGAHIIHRCNGQKQSRMMIAPLLYYAFFYRSLQNLVHT